MFNNQELLKLVTFSYILMTFLFDSKVRMKGEIKCQSLGVKGFSKISTGGLMDTRALEPGFECKLESRRRRLIGLRYEQDTILLQYPFPSMRTKTSALNSSTGPE